MTATDNAIATEAETTQHLEEAWTPEAEAELAKAVEALEATSFAQRIGRLIGREIGHLGDFLPAALVDAANDAASKALSSAMRAVLTTLWGDKRPAAPRLHLTAAIASGALGGAFGLFALPIELPLSTAIILRSVADIGREEGEDLSDPEAVLACLGVFALGADPAPSASRALALSVPPDAFGPGSYFAVRALLAKSVSEAAAYLAQRSLADEAAPVLVRLVGQVASRFGAVVSQKAFAQSIPVIGALTGGAINAAFTDHFQRLARAHFTVRRLERRHGAAKVRSAYDALRAALRETGAAAKDQIAGTDAVVGSRTAA